MNAALTYFRNDSTTAKTLSTAVTNLIIIKS